MTERNLRLRLMQIQFALNDHRERQTRELLVALLQTCECSEEGVKRAVQLAILASDELSAHYDAERKVLAEKHLALKEKRGMHHD